MIGVTGAQSMSAVVSTTRDMRPRPALVRSKSDEEQSRLKNQECEKVLLGQLGFLTRGLMMGMVLLVSLEPVSALKVDRLTMAPTDRRRLPACRLDTGL